MLLEINMLHTYILCICIVTAELGDRWKSAEGQLSLLIPAVVTETLSSSGCLLRERDDVLAGRQIRKTMFHCDDKSCRRTTQETGLHVDF